MVFISTDFPLARRMRRLRARGKLAVAGGGENGGGGKNPPEFRKIPTEVFCHPFSDTGKEAQSARQAQFCRLLGKECDKPRKSDPTVKVGACSVGYKGGFRAEFSPVIICPHRFREESVLADIAAHYFPQAQSLVWVKEVSMEAGGSVDYVGFISDGNGGVEDFLCVEFQAAGTTGTPWDGIVALREGRPLEKSYNYGINWANEFLKTMMQQAFKKGKIVDSWGRKIVFVMQDIGLEYIRSAVDDSDLRAARDEDPVHFCTFAMKWEGRGGWRLRHAERVSTDIAGIVKILGGANLRDCPSVEAFKRNIWRKAARDKIVSDP